MHTQMVILGTEVGAIDAKRSWQRSRNERPKLAAAIEGLREAKFSAIIIVPQSPHFEHKVGNFQPLVDRKNQTFLFFFRFIGILGSLKQMGMMGMVWGIAKWNYGRMGRGENSGIRVLVLYIVRKKKRNFDGYWKSV